MKPKIHPKYKPLRVLIGDDTFHTCSTLDKNELFMDVDYRKHPAWTKEGSNIVNQSNKNISKFNQKFAGLNFGIK